VKSVLENLGKYLKSSIPAIVQVTYEWPAPNVQLKYPSLSIISGDPQFTPGMVRELSRGTISGHKSNVKSIIGEYDFNLQLDFWCRDKVERSTLYEEFFWSFNPDSSAGGLSLQMADYHGIWCRYDLTGYKLSDAESSSQRAEWRLMINILANTSAVREKAEFVMETIENDLNFPDTIVNG
jgi:hypothetical protein